MRANTRRRPAVVSVIEHWQARSPDTFPNILAHAIGWDEPFCFRCGWLAPLPDDSGTEPWVTVGGWLELAHLHDRAAGGADEAVNVVPLCPLCHHAMPAFTDGPERAIAWVQASQPCSHQSWWQTATDVRWGGEEWAPYPGWKTFFGFLIYAGEVVQRHEVQAAGVAA